MLKPLIPEASAHHAQLLAHLREAIHAADGQITFAHYMELALYAPTLGYYSAGAAKLGAKGDFITAPELSPLFSDCLATQCQQILAGYPKADILELGAGSGIMAADILLALEKQNTLPEHYYILDLSADLKERQRTTLLARVPHLFHKIHWLDRLPTQKITGVILANEVLDAMPVARFHADHQQISEWYVRLENNHFVWHKDKPSTPQLIEHVEKLCAALQQPFEDYDSEINLQLTPWLRVLSDTFEKGLILFIDYGFLQHEFYHPARNRGTLMCHYQHRAHTDPFLHVGLQDITTHVDFTAVAKSAVAAGLSVAGYTPQARFLLNCGLMDHAEALQPLTPEAEWQMHQKIKKLTLPHEMGELFKAIALTRGVDDPLRGFI